MLRTLSISTAAVLVVALSIHCGGDDSEGEGGAAPTGATSTGTGTGDGGSGGTGSTSTGSTTTSTTSQGGGQTGPLPTCDGSVEDEGECVLGAPSCATTTGCCQCQEILNCGVIWTCVDPPGEDGCPSDPPGFSETCTTEGLLCEYCVGAQVELWRCLNGTWVERMAGCTGPT